MPDWNLVLTTLGGTNRAFLADAKGLSPTRRFNGSNALKFTLPTQSDGADELATASVAVRAYRDGIGVFNGQVVGLNYKPGVIEVTCNDPWALLAHRFLAALKNANAEDAGQVLADVLAAENARKNTWLRMGSIAASSNVTTKYEADKQVDTIGDELSQMSGGPFFRIDPVFDDPTCLGEIVVLYPDAGTDRPDVRFEYGEDTIANLADYSVDVGLPINRVVAIGPGTGETQPKGIADQSAADDYLLEAQMNFAATDTATLTKLATDQLRLTGPRTYSVTPIGNDDDAAGQVTVPKLFDDYDVGDVGRILIHDYRVKIAGTARINEATLTVHDESGLETLSSATLETVS